MINKAFVSLVGTINNAKEKTIFLFLSMLSFFIRFPFFFRDYIDRDESTFILIGQSWVDGHLPFTELWDVKPPLTFLYFASIIYLFGKSFLAIRIFGALLVVISSFFTYKICSMLSTKIIGFWAAIASVCLLSLFGSLQGVMSEHITMAFFMFGLYLIISKKRYYWFFFAGILMGIAVMVKLNMAYAILLLGLYLIVSRFLEKKIREGTLYAIAYGIGILLIIGITIIPYHEEGLTNLWWKSVVEAPLEYAAARRYSFFKMAPLILILVGFFIWVYKKGYVDFKNKTNQLLLIVVIGVLISFVKGGRINGHYLIQLHPILTIYISIVLAKFSLVLKPTFQKIFFVIVLLIPMESYLEYINIIKNKLSLGTFYNGEGISVPNYIIEKNLDTENIIFFGYHIGYWVLDVKPPTKASTHPSNICKDEMFFAYDNPRKTAMEEIRYIMEELRPKTVVVRKDRLVFDRKEIEENEYIDAYLAKHYKVYAIVENAEILQRLEGL